MSELRYPYAFVGAERSRCSCSVVFASAGSSRKFGDLHPVGGGGQLEEVAAVVVSKRGGAVTEVVIGP